MVYYGDIARTVAERPMAPHHYRFVHYVLRLVAFARPMDCLGLFASEPDEFIAQLWSMLLECCEGEGEPEFGPQAITVHIARVGAYPCAVVEMPTPRHATEAHFAAMLLPIEVDDLNAPPDPVPLRFFTLEHAQALDGNAPFTMLCEWTREGSHLNGGVGPPPRLEPFLSAVAVRLGTSPGI